MPSKEKKPSNTLTLSALGLILMGVGAILYAVFRKPSGSSESLPVNLSDMTIEELEEQLDQCLDENVQDYERAARIRDLIKTKMSHISSPKK